jgi:hypothetical protein
MSFEITGDTLLRALLAHIQSNMRQHAALRVEHDLHPDAAALSDALRESRKMWKSLSSDLVEVLGPEAALKPFNQLAKDGSFHAVEIIARDPFRITIRELKRRADKARLKKPEINLLKSWAG